MLRDVVWVKELFPVDLINSGFKDSAFFHFVVEPLNFDSVRRNGMGVVGLKSLNVRGRLLGLRGTVVKVLACLDSLGS